MATALSDQETNELFTLLQEVKADTLRLAEDIRDLRRDIEQAETDNGCSLTDAEVDDLDKRLPSRAPALQSP